MTRQPASPVGETSVDCDLRPIVSGFDRRRLLRIAVAGFAGAALVPRRLFAAKGKYDAMMLSCIDPRFQEPVCQWAAKQKLVGKYSHFAIAGAAIGVVAPAFKDWHKTFWDNLAASVELHGIDKVIAIDHRDCGAAKIAYGEAAVANAAAETKTHREALAEFRKQLAANQPKLGVETGLMSLDGSLEVMT
jgi:carbonic anhydrase